MPPANLLGRTQEAHQRQDFAVARIEHDGCTVGRLAGVHHAEVVEALFGRPLQIGIDGQLQRVSNRRLLRTQISDLASQAVDDDRLLPFDAHQQLVVGLLDARLTDDGSRLDPRVLCPLKLRLRTSPT